jgi:catechol 2,3-dioxygenase-like lactoylglutathione lyase family enzyme
LADPITTLVQQHGIKQMALVVRDIDASMRAYWELLRMGPWTGYTLTPEILEDMHYRGGPGDFSFRHALAWKDGVQMELIQPLSGRSIFDDFLREHGEGLHHVGIYVPDQPRAVAELKAAGFRPLQGARGFGAKGDGAFDYFETDHPLATIIEVIGAPSERRPASFVYPTDPN